MSQNRNIIEILHIEDSDLQDNAFFGALSFFYFLGLVVYVHLALVVIAPVCASKLPSFQSPNQPSKTKGENEASSH